MSTVFQPLQLLTTTAVLSLVSILPINPAPLAELPLNLTAPAYAGQKVRWTPSPSMGSVGSSISGGRRGELTASCQSANGRGATLSLLVPGQTGALLTTRANPTVSWYVNTESPVSMQVVLEQAEVANPILTKTIEVKRSGIVSLPLPAQASLQVGTRYRWRVLLACGGSANQVYARSFIQRVDQPIAMAGRSELEQAIAYADQGIWYDALDAMIRAYHRNPANAALQSELKSLLQQAEVEMVDDTARFSMHSGVADHL